MKNTILSARLGFVSVAVLAAAATRFMPHAPNFTAIGAMALFAGACMPNRWLSLLVPAFAMLVTDAIIGFHPTLWAVYSSFALITMMGWAIRNKQNVLNIGVASVAAAVLFFLVTNSAMWVTDQFLPAAQRFYPTTINGLWLSIYNGIPFAANTILSQVLYGAVLFGAFHAAKAWKPSLIKVKA